MCRLLFLVLTPFVLWSLATPLFMMSEPENVSLAGSLAASLVGAALFVWWFALFTQRRILERTPVGLDDSAAQGLTAELERDE